MLIQFQGTSRFSPLNCIYYIYINYIYLSDYILAKCCWALLPNFMWNLLFKLMQIFHCCPILLSSVPKPYSPIIVSHLNYIQKYANFKSSLVLMALLASLLWQRCQSSLLDMHVLLRAGAQRCQTAVARQLIMHS